MSSHRDVAIAQPCGKDHLPNFVNAGARPQAEQQLEGAIAHDDVHNKNGHVTSKVPKLSLEREACGHGIVEGHALGEEAAQRVGRDKPTLTQDSRTPTADGDDDEARETNEVRTHVPADVKLSGNIAHVSRNLKPSDSTVTDDSWGTTAGIVADAGHDVCAVCTSQT